MSQNESRSRITNSTTEKCVDILVLHSNISFMVFLFSCADIPRTFVERQLLWAYDIPECFVAIERLSKKTLQSLQRSSNKTAPKERVDQILEEHNYFKRQ